MLKLNAVVKSTFSRIVCSKVALSKSHFSKTDAVKSVFVKSTSFSLQFKNRVFLRFRALKEESCKAQCSKVKSIKKSDASSNLTPIILQWSNSTSLNWVLATLVLLRLHSKKEHSIKF